MQGRLFFAVALVLVALMHVGAYIPSFRTSGPRHFTRKITNDAIQQSTRSHMQFKNRRSALQPLFMSSLDDNPFYKNQDAYQILGVSRSATKAEIKKAFRKQTATFHPDKFPDDAEKKKEGNLRMEKINRAYFCLGEDDRKRRYDQYGEAGVGTSAASEDQIRKAGGPGMGGGFGGGGGAVDVGDLSDIFDAFFGGAGGGGGGFGGSGFGGNVRQQRRNPNAPIPGDDIQVEIEVPFEYVIKGGEEKIKIRRMEECGTCTGTGIKPGAKMRSCSTCGGSGMVNQMQRTPFGTFSNVQPCPSCRGTGQEIEEYCPSCKGKGSVSETAEVKVRVPAGIDTGTNLRVRSGGNAGKRGGPRGDLFVQVRIKNDAKFKREGTEIYTDEEISYVDAILGTTIKADTVDGKVDVKIPAGTQPGQKLRLKDKGAPKLGTDFRGDAYITVKVKIPSSVGGKEKELLEQISEMSGKKGGFFGGFGG